MEVCVSSIEEIISRFGFAVGEIKIQQFGSGLINQTWKITSRQGDFILQKINEHVFGNVKAIANNISQVGAWLQEHHPGYYFTRPLKSMAGEEMICENELGCWRMFPFVRGSHTIDIVTHPQQAFEAARQFGKFTRLLQDFDTSKLHITIPHFHDLEYRFEKFKSAVEYAGEEKMQQAEGLVNRLLSLSAIVTDYLECRQDKQCRLRVTHHDAKISNVLFDENEKGICVIDLDTVMPGYFISDVGDMIRSYLSPSNEEDINAQPLRPEYFEAIVHGYFSEMKTLLTATEREHFFFAGKYMIYMQALRFMTDHLEGDLYYPVRYSGQNFLRAKSQVQLLDNYLAAEKTLRKMVERLF
jgi:thiamine kinase-like enzyme